jgi:hypothetical protein
MDYILCPKLLFEKVTQPRDLQAGGTRTRNHKKTGPNKEKKLN